MEPDKQSKAGSSIPDSRSHKRSSSATINDNSSSKRHKEIDQRNAFPREQYVYVVTQTESGLWRETERNIRGTYAGLNDANNEVISFWELESDMMGSETQKGNDEWGCIWWKSKDLESNCVRAKVARLVVKPESGNIALVWGRNAPGVEQDEDETSSDEDWQRPLNWDKNTGQSSRASSTTIAPKRELGL
jgi:hypothetical protein